MNRVSISTGNPPSASRLYVVLVSFISNTIDGFVSVKKRHIAGAE